MAAEDLSRDLVVDLMRSSWIVESARALVYDVWSGSDGRFEASSARARERAEVVERALEKNDRAPDRDLARPHADWMLSLVGEEPFVTAFGDLFLIRLGDWVDAHAGPFFGDAAGTMKRLAAEEKEGMTFPDHLPAPPPFEPVETIEVDPPGEILFRFAILADLHFGSARGAAHAHAAIDDINGSGAEFTIQLGDITDQGEKEEFEQAVEGLRKLEMPLTTMMGNHDVLSISESRLSGREYYSSTFDREPDGVLFDHKGFNFAVLDSVEHAASPFAAFNLVTGEFFDGPGGAIVRGALTPPQHEILADIAAPGAAPAFVFLHHPPQPFTGFPPVLFGLREADSGRLHAAIDSGNVWGVFAGHTHRNKRTRDFGGVPAHEVAIPRDYPFGYALVDVTKEGYAFRFVQISDEKLLRDAYPFSGTIHRRYGRGTDAERSFVWRKP